MSPIFVKALIKNRSFTDTLLLPLFNAIFRAGYVPRVWKLDRRILLEKKGDRTDPMNYRPIAIHSVFRKLLCSMIERRERQMISFDPTQYGFLPGRRTSDLAALLNDIIRSHHSTNKEAYIAVIDFRKAFDSCHIPTLLRKKAEHGITGRC